MKIAVLADIHANFEALQTVADHVERWKPDHVAVAGDVVNRGPRSPECLRFVQHKQHTDGWQVVRGNHEDYVIQWDSPDANTSGLKFEIFKLAYWTFEQLNCNVGALRAMPFQVSLPAPDNFEVRVVHASMKNNRTGIFPFTPDDKLREKIAHPNQSPPALLCVGHTHIPVVRQIDDTLIVNAGSVGLPFDGDTRAAYAQLTWQQGHWTAKIIRLDYDRNRAEQDYTEYGFLDGAGPMAQLVLDELRTAKSRLYGWMEKYYQPTLNGQISLDDAVNRFLHETNGRQP